MVQTIKLSELMGTEFINRETFNQVDGAIVCDMYQMPLGKVISVNTKSKKAEVDIFDENPHEFIKAFRRLIRRKNEITKTDGIHWRSTALKAAEDFEYGEEVIKQINNAKNDMEVSRIMRDARHKKFG